MGQGQRERKEGMEEGGGRREVERETTDELVSSNKRHSGVVKGEQASFSSRPAPRRLA